MYSARCFRCFLRKSRVVRRETAFFAVSVHHLLRFSRRLNCNNLLSQFGPDVTRPEFTQDFCDNSGRVATEHLLMMEQPDTCKRHHNPIFITYLNHIVVAHGAAGLGYIFHSALMSAFNVVSKREEGIRAKGDTAHLV